MTIATLKDIQDAAIRQLLGFMCYGPAGLAIHGTDKTNLRTTTSVNVTINGYWYTLSTKPLITLSTLSGRPTEPLPDGYSQMFTFSIRFGIIYVNYGEQIPLVDIDDGSRDYDIPPPREGTTAFGTMRVRNTSGADYVFGVTDLTTAGILDLYEDVSLPPAISLN